MINKKKGKGTKNEKETSLSTYGSRIGIGRQRGDLLFLYGSPKPSCLPVTRRSLAEIIPLLGGEGKTGLEKDCRHIPARIPAIACILPAGQRGDGLGGKL